jgi:uncharacterized membrane protein YdfJ with MMPL/SSD domain
MARQLNVAATLGGWSARHRLIAIGSWVLLVVLATLIGSAAGQVAMTTAQYGTGESGRALGLLADAGIQPPAQELVLVHSTSATAASGGFQSAVRAVVANVEATGQVYDMRAPAVSPSRHDVLVQFAMKGDPDTADKRVQPVLDAVAAARAAHQDVTIEQYGDASGNKYFSDTILKDMKRAEWTVVPVAIGILLVVFGALVAALLPVVLALTAFMAANGLLAVISHAMHVDQSTSSVMLLMGMAVGVDYCLFYLRREREERARGRDPDAALRIAAATSGRSVLVSGMTVIVAMAGMFLAGMQLFDGFAVATILVVLIAMAGSVTVLPALMSLLGDKVEFGRVPFLHRVSQPANGSRIWTAVLDRVLDRPGVSAAVAGGALLVLASPVVGLHTERLTVPQTLPASTSLVQSYEHIMKAFPGGPTPAVVVVKAPDIRSASVRQGIAALAGWRSPALGRPVEVTVYPAANLATISLPLAGNGTDAVSRQALATLHNTIMPATVGKIPGGQALVDGDLAFSIDFNNQLRFGIIPVLLFVLAVTFILMLTAFNSIVIAATTIGLNLLSVGAAYGAMVAVFQHGWGAGLLGTTAPGALESWIPLFVFVVLFGLSMDYNVFVVSRIKEAHDRGMATREAISHGIRTTAGVVTSAAVIMVAVFAVFGSLSMQQFKQLSVGLAVAVLLDATVVRGVLLPSVMALLGDRNWYLPRWLSWLPKPGAPGGPGGPGDVAAPAESPPEPAPAPPFAHT